jgi:peroxiredoxin
MIPSVGEAAPDICLKSHLGDTIRLSEYRGRKNIVLAFFPLAWTPI